VLPPASRRRGNKELVTLKVERNAVRAPIWFPRPGVPVQLALDAPGLPFLGDRIRIDALNGTLTTADLVVFTHLCSWYLARRPSDRRIEVSVSEVARWLGARSIGGEQRRMARECLGRLLGATVTSRMRWTDRSSERLVEGWHLVDRWVLPEGGRHAGLLWLGATVTSLLEAGSVVLMDSRLLATLYRRSAVATRLWMYLEDETLVSDEPHRYGVYDAPPGRPAGERHMAALADMLRLTDRQRGQTVLALRRACALIEDIDPRYALTVEWAVESQMWNLVAARDRTRPHLGTQVLWARAGAGLVVDVAAVGATVPGDQGNADGASRATMTGVAGNAPRRRRPPGEGMSTLGKGAVQATLSWAPDVPLPTGLPEGQRQTAAVAGHRTGTPARPRSGDGATTATSDIPSEGASS
jgi:hypothetical protein